MLVLKELFYTLMLELRQVSKGDITLKTLMALFQRTIKLLGCHINTMLLQKEVRKKSGNVGGKKIEVVSNTLDKIVVVVNGERHTIKTAGKTDKQLGEEIRNL